MKCGWGDWISVKERLPENHQLVLAVPKDVACPTVLRFESGRGTVNGYLFMHPNMTAQVLHISYWMPCPETPNE